jgi:hypothetical protein
MIVGMSNDTAYRHKRVIAVTVVECSRSGGDHRAAVTLWLSRLQAPTMKVVAHSEIECQHYGTALRA